MIECLGAASVAAADDLTSRAAALAVEACEVDAAELVDIAQICTMAWKGGGIEKRRRGAASVERAEIRKRTRVAECD